MKSYPKTIKRTFKNNLGRFFAITLIVMLGLAIISGLGALSPITRTSVTDNLHKYNASDLIFKSTSSLGFATEQIEEIVSFDGVEDYQTLFSIDLDVNGVSSRVFCMDFSLNTVNKLSLVEGAFPSGENQIVVERQISKMHQYKIGDKIEFFGKTFEIVGIVANPIIYSKDGEPNLNDQEPLEAIMYLDSAYTNFGFNLPVTDLYVKLNQTANLDYFSKQYKNAVKEVVLSFEENLSFDSYKILTMEDNKSFIVTQSYTDKVNKISFVFPLFFIAVVILVVSTTMTRLIDEERQIIGCYKTLGYGNGKIIFKYVLFSAVSCLAGCIAGTLIGVFALPEIIYPGFNSVIFIPEMTRDYSFLLGIIVSIGMLVSVAGITAIVISRNLKEKPADLLRPKSPKPGKKILFEKIPFIWNRTKFKYKSALRNIFRYKKHFIMTLVSVGGATAIVFAGFSLYNAVTTSEKLVAIADAIAQISSVLIVFACGLCLLVIYNLTNMNIAERTREIATLKVLGYHKFEVATYIYREIFIMSIIAIALGIPVGCLLVWFLFGYLDIGVLSDVSWWPYIATLAVLIGLILIIDLLLLNKINKVDMNTSLKMVD